MSIDINETLPYDEACDNSLVSMGEFLAGCPQICNMAAGVISSALHNNLAILSVGSERPAI